MSNIKLNKADGKGLSIPAHAVISVIGVENSTPGAFPTAKALIRYDFGSGIQFVWIAQSASDVMDQVNQYDITKRPWVEFANPEGDSLFLLAPAIKAYEGLQPNSDVEGPQPMAVVYFDSAFGAHNPAETDIKWAQVVEDEDEVARRIEEVLTTEVSVEPTAPRRKK